MEKENIEVKYSNLYMKLIDLSTKIENARRSLSGGLPLGAQGPCVMDLQQHKERIIELLDTCEKQLRAFNQEMKAKAEENEFNELNHQYACLVEALKVSMDEMKARHLG